MTLPIGSTIGILGGGQLGRLSAIAAAQLGYRAHIYCPEQDSPAFEVSAYSTCAPYEDHARLKEFASKCAVVTYEFENVPADAAKLVSNYSLLRPGIDILRLSQNRLREKRFARSLGIETTDIWEITSLNDLKHALKENPGEYILKTCELGYDGKGQTRISTNTDLQAAWTGLATQSAILESLVPFEKEISVIVARNAMGACAPFSVAENFHEDGILKTSNVPAKIGSNTASQATRAAIALAHGADVVGLLAVEFFVAPNGVILFNEMAPRPHNSGHWTLDGCATSQFEQLVRAICDLPFSSTRVLCEVAMHNLIGSDIDSLSIFALSEHAKLHLYGKSETRAGRKMGHINYLAPFI